MNIHSGEYKKYKQFQTVYEMQSPQLIKIISVLYLIRQQFIYFNELFVEKTKLAILFNQRCKIN